VKHALELDEANGNKLWSDAIEKEINELLAHDTFIIKETRSDVPDGYQFIPSHMILDIKFDGRRKTRLVAGVNFTNPDEHDIYSGVISIDSVRILLFIADLNKLLVIAADISNAYLHGSTNEKVYTTVNYGELTGKALIIDKAQYGLKTSAARWHEVANVLLKMKFKPSKADMDLWMREKEGEYEYIAVYVDDLIVASRDPMSVIEEVKTIGNFQLKGVGEPEYYLGGDIERKKRKDTGELYTKISAKTYITNICEKIERIFKIKLKNYHSPLEGGYHPELDQTDLLDEEGITNYRMLIGSLNWTVTLGRFDIMFLVVAMARYNAMPREGHLKTCLRIFGYLKHHAKGAILFDTTVPDMVGERLETKYNWSQLYPDAEEKIPLDAPSPQGKPVKTWIMWDADHAHDIETRRSVSGVLVFLNNTPIKWHSKRQHTVETSTYGSEMTSLKVAVEIAIELRYKLRMLGVRIDGPTEMIGDNRSVVMNVSKPESMLKKKSNLCSYHYCREANSCSIVTYRSITSKQNFADCFTKALAPNVLYDLIKPWLFRNYLG